MKSVLDLIAGTAAHFLLSQRENTQILPSSNFLFQLLQRNLLEKQNLQSPLYQYYLRIQPVDLHEAYLLPFSRLVANSNHNPILGALKILVHTGQLREPKT